MVPGSSAKAVHSGATIPGPLRESLVTISFYTVESNATIKETGKTTKVEDILFQLRTLMWLKWTLFRNSLRSSKAVANRIATVFATLIALVLALLIAFGLGVAAYVLTSPKLGLQNIQPRPRRGEPSIPPAEFIFFSIFSLVYLLWASLPLSIGSSRQFDPGNLLLYPISLRKLFAIDFFSEVASLQSLFAIPAILAVGIGAGLAQERLGSGILMAIAAIVFGMSLSKWIAVSVGSLIRKKRTRGETLLALIGVVAGLGGALFGQIAPVLVRHAGSISALRWTPPGATAYALAHGLRQENSVGFALALTVIAGYSVILIYFAYWLARRAVLGGGRKRRGRNATVEATIQTDPGWQIPLMSPATSAIIEKELRYVMRNAQLRMMTLMPLVLIAVRFMNRRNFGAPAGPGSRALGDFSRYGEGLMATGGVLYVFLILTGLFCNQFAFDRSGIRTLILSPVDRKSILVGKNIALATVAFVFSAALLMVNELVFRDITLGALLFVALSFLTFLPLMSVMGNFCSVRFPKQMRFGKRLNVSGVVGLLLIPMIIVLALPPLAATAAGYIARSLLIEYATLGGLAVVATGIYVLAINAQGESLQKRELEILEAVNDPGMGDE
jgi:hypothetical protein